jgi:hypothetical protein
MCIKDRGPGNDDDGGMSTATMTTSAPTCLPPAARAPVQSVFLPKEHGSWSLVLEPLALGLLVAPSWAGGALAGAVLAGFFARRPLKAAHAPVPSVRRHEARATVVMWSALVVAGLFEAGVLGGWSGLWPLLPAAWLGAVFVWFEAQGESRAAAAEAAGCAAFALVPAAVATLAGRPVATALMLAVVALARSVPTVLVVRTCLRLAKGSEAERFLPLLASAVAFGALGVIGAEGPGLAVVLGAILLGRALWLLGPWRPAWPARRIGQMEAALGLLYVVLLAVRWPPA